MFFKMGTLHHQPVVVASQFHNGLEVLVFSSALERFNSGLLLRLRLTSKISTWLVVTGTWIMTFPSYWEWNNHPN